MTDPAMERKVLIRAADIIPMGWCQHAIGWVAGEQIDETDARLAIADRVRMEGALHRAAKELGADAGTLNTAICRMYSHLHELPHAYNDAPGRTADEVEAALRAAAAEIAP